MINMKHLFCLAVLCLTLEFSLSAQTLTIEDMVKNIRQIKEIKAVKEFVGKHGFVFDTVLVQNKTSKVYSYLSTKEFSVVGLDEDTITMNNAVFLRIDEEKYLRKITLMTGVKEYYQELVVEMVKNKFKAIGEQNPNRPMSYNSELYKNVMITLSIVESLKEEKRYARYQIVVNY